MPLLSSAPTSDNHTITPPGLRPGGDPARRPTGLDEEKRMRRPPPGTIPASTATTSAGRLLGRSQQAASIPMPNMRPAADGRRGQDTRLAGARRTTTHGRIAPAMPARRAPRHHLTMSKEHTPPPGPNRAGGARTGCFASGGRARPGPRRPHLPVTGKRGLVGLGRLERPTSRLSGVRSNQLSYRPERHPAGPGTRAARAGRTQDLVTADLWSDGCVRRDVQTAAGDFDPSRSIKIDRMDPTCMPGACTRRWGPREVVERDRRQQVPPTQTSWGAFRKEVIQPQVPLRLPCYDFTPVADPTVDACPPCGLAQRLRVEPTPMV